MAAPTYPQDMPALTDTGAKAPGIAAGQPITYDECVATKNDDRAKARRLTTDNATIEATNQQDGTPGWFEQAMAPFIQQLQASNKVSLGAVYLFRRRRK